MAIIKVKSWYQLDFSLLKASEAKDVLLRIDNVMSELKSFKLVGKWFFLFEEDTIRVRIKSKNGGALKKEIDKLVTVNNLSPSDKLPFSEYQESDETMFNLTIAEAFADIMSEVTKLTISKLKGNLSFDNYRVLERLQHCMFNNLLTFSFKKEEYFLQQRLLERFRQQADKDFENKV